MTLPRRIGPYRVLDRIGRGGMAEVFRALAVGASGFEKVIALKVLREEHRGDAELERMLIDEARLGAKLSHRNLLSVHDLGVDEGAYYVRMDYVHGANLSALSRAAPPSPELTLQIAEEVALALAYVHSLADDAGRPLGLVHRDVSPSNVLLSRDGEVKLADFGIAKATRLASNTAAAIRRGKYAYMSPEQISGAPLSSRSDQFGFGVMLHELLLGERPFDGGTPLETMDRIREAEPPPLRSLPADLSAIVSTCLARDPDERFETAEALQRALGVARRLRDPSASADLARWVRATLDGEPPSPAGPSSSTATLPITEELG